MKLYRIEKYSYRFMDLSGTMMLKFKDVKVKSIHKIIKLRTDETFNIIFMINDCFDIKEIQKLINELGIDEKVRGLWISLYTESDSDGVHVPIEVRNVYMKLGGQLDFSFTFCEDDTSCTG